MPAEPAFGAETVLRAEVAAPIARLWWAWTTSEGRASWLSNENRMELRTNGPFEIYFDSKIPGERGSEGRRVLAYLKPELLAFSWNFPPTLPSIRSEQTFVVVRFYRLEAHRTRVTLDQGGWVADPIWEEGYRYFVRAWGNVMRAMTEAVPRLRTPDQRRDPRPAPSPTTPLEPVID